MGCRLIVYGRCGQWGGRIGYVGNLLGCPYIQCNPPFVHSSNKAWSVPRLLRHSGSGLGVLGGTGAQCAAHGKRQRGGGALRYHGLMHLFSFSALEHGGASRGFHAPSAIIFGVQGHTGTPAFPVPVGNTGTNF